MTPRPGGLPDDVEGMDGDMTTVGGVSQVRGTRWRVWQLLAAAAAIAAAVALGHRVAEHGTLAAIWPVNAVALGILLITPRGQVLRCAAVLMLAFLAASVLLADRADPVAHIGFSVGATAINIIALLLAYLVLTRNQAWIDGDTERLSQWARAGVGGILVPQALAAVLATAYITAVRDLPISWSSLWATGVAWFGANTVAMSLLIPIILRLRPRYLRTVRPARVGELAGLIAVLGCAAVLIMLQGNAVLLLLLMVPLSLLTFRHGIVGVVGAAAVLGPILLGFTSASSGPFLAAAGGPGPALLWAQLFLVLLLAVAYLTVTLLAEPRAAGAEPTDYRELVEGFADPVLLIDGQGIIRYAAPATSAATGIATADLVGQHWLARVHPGDVAAAEQARQALSSSTDVTTSLCRVRCADGSWRWFDSRLTLAGESVVVLPRDVTATIDHQR